MKKAFLILIWAQVAAVFAFASGYKQVTDVPLSFQSSLKKDIYGVPSSVILKCLNGNKKKIIEVAPYNVIRESYRYARVMGRPETGKYEIWVSSNDAHILEAGDGSSVGHEDLSKLAECDTVLFK